MAEIKRSLAVVIGINQYVNGIPALKTAVNDAKKIAHILETKYQYQALRLLDEDATGVHLKELFAAFEQQTLPLPDGSKTQLHPNDRLLFYFAGHGIALDALDNADGPVGFLVPQDARMDNDSSLLPMKRLHDALLALPCRHLLVILDCCFAGAFRWAGQRDAVRSQKMYRERYERFISGCAQQVITSAADDEKAADSLYRFGQRSEHEGHSPFAELLLKGLSGEADYSCDGAITATELYVYIHSELGKTSAKQTPGFSQLKRHDKGEYIFPIPGFKANKLEEAPKLDEKANPYKGLESFEERDSEKFFGRRALIETLQEFVNNHPLTVVLGASGSGKSSLVKAGLIPQLKKQREQWRVLDPIRPGESPFRALNHALERENLPVFAIPNKPTDELASEDARKKGNSSNSTLWYEQGLQNLSFNLVAWRNLYPNSKLLLVIDQSEELVTLSRDEVEREMFLKGLARALKAFPDWLRIVLTLRSDFEPQFRETALEPYWSGARFIVPAMTREELRQAIVEPATAKVMYFEPPKLVDQLIDEVVQMPGALPLLSFTLSELYLKYIKSVREGKRNNRAITQEDYEQLGGVARSLTQRADCEYEELVKLDPAYEQTVRHVMLRMVALSGSELARRQVDLSELEYPEPKNERVKLVIERFATARLLVKGRDIEGNLYVEPAHDALVRGWQKLRTWKDRELASLLLQRELTAIANKWATSKQDKQAVGLLWDDDPRLPLVKHVLESDDNWLNSLESEFVQRSIQRQLNNRRRTIGIVSAVMISLSGLTVIAINQAIQANLKTLNALSSSSAALLASNQELEALIEGIKAGKLLKQPFLEFFAPNDVKVRVANTLRQATYEIKEYNRLQGFGNDVTSIDFSPNGEILASARASAIPNKNIKLWTLKGKEIKALPEINDGVMEVRFSPNGQLIAWAVYNHKNPIVRLANLEGRELKTFRGHSKLVSNFSFSPDGQIIATVSEDQTIKLWGLNGRQLKTLRGHKGSVLEVDFSPDSQTLVSGSIDGTVKFWKRNGELLKTFPAHGGGVLGVRFSPDGQKIASVGRDNTVKLWNLNGKLLQTFTGHSGIVYTVRFSPSGQTLASASADKTIKLWSLDGKLLYTFQGHDEDVFVVRFSPDGKTIASASKDKTVKFWSVNGMPSVVLQTAQGTWANGVSFSNDGQLIATATADDSAIDDKAAPVDPTVKLWSSNGKLLHVLKGHEKAVWAVRFSPDSKKIVSASADKTVRIWSLDGRLLHTFKGHSGKVNSISFSPDGKKVVSASDDKTVKLWNLDATTLQETFEEHDQRVLGVSFSPDGQIIASASADKTVRLWHPNGRLLQSLKADGDMRGVSFSPDGKVIAAASADNTVRLWRRIGQSFQPFGKPLQGHSDAVISVSFRPDGKVIASASADQTVKLWSLDGELLQTLQGHNDWVKSVGFSPDGKVIASTSLDSRVILWNLDLDNLLVRGCNWLHDYLKTNLSISESDRHTCDGIGN